VKDIKDVLPQFGYEGFDGKSFFFAGVANPIRVAKDALGRVLNKIDKNLVPSYGLSNEDSDILLGAKYKNAQAQTQLLEIMKSLETNGVGALTKYKDSSVRLFVDASGKAKGKCLVVDMGSRKVLDVEPGAYTLAAGLGADFHRTIKDVGFVVFDPTSPDFLTEDMLGDAPVTRINSYSPPEWLEWNSVAVMPDFLNTLLTHLFPNEEEREDVLDWFHYALTGRCQTVLVLAGNKGTGKNLLLSIFSQVIGQDYSTMAGQNQLDGNFNSAFDQKRLVVFDEVQISTTKATNNMKQFCNDRISLEKKGIDAYTIDNFSSIVILTNNFANLAIENTDRRYSVPEVAEIRLNRVVSEDEIGKIAEAIKNKTDFGKSLIANFGKFLVERNPKRKVFYAIKGDYFFYITEMAQKAWVAFLLDYVADHGVAEKPIFMVDVRTAYNSAKGKDIAQHFPIAKRTLEKEFKDFKIRGEIPLGTIAEYQVGGKQNKVKVALIPTQEAIDALLLDRERKKKIGTFRERVQVEEEEVDYGIVDYSKEDEIKPATPPKDEVAEKEEEEIDL